MGRTAGARRSVLGLMFCSILCTLVTLDRDGFLSRSTAARESAASARKSAKKSATPEAPPAATSSDLEFFEKRIRPILVEHCHTCHSGKVKTPKGGLRLDLPEAVRIGGDSGPVIVPGKPDESSLLAALSYSGTVSEMPPKGKLPDRVLADFRKWIELGAPFPASASTPPDLHPQTRIDFATGRRFWSFQPVKVYPLPKVSNPAWPRNRIDHFILQELDRHAMRPAAEAERRTLLRRVYSDLIGLPPTHTEIAAFVMDASPTAYERIVNRLLGSPQYGERWARHWLDVVRYAEDNPTSESTCKPPRFPFQYRDWVIRALNSDMSFKEFIRRQLAADQLDLAPDQIAALGMLGLSPVYHKEPKLSKEVISVIVADEWDERVDTITRGILGLTVACARCHDHKFDPISSRDYYALAGVVASTQLVEWPLVATDRAAASALSDIQLAIVDDTMRLGYARQMQKTALAKGQDGAPYEKAAALIDARLKTLKAKQLFDGPIANAVRDAGLWIDGNDPAWTLLDFRPGQARDLPVFIRGNVNQPGEIVPRRFLEVLAPTTPPPFKKGSGRLELADCIVGQAAPLTARVIVNRVWGWHFGQPLVRTPSNFGVLGERPSHPELLDDLTARFIAQGWSLKWLHREIVLSATWRQASSHDTGYRQKDSDNRQLWQMNRRRLEPEAWRDAVLSVSGDLDLTFGGPSESLDKPENRRRTIYGTVSRQKPPDLFRLFDFPDAKAHTEQRLLTTTPLQQLYLLNSPFLQKQAARIVERTLTDPSAKPAETVRLLFQRILLRDPTAIERADALNLVQADLPKNAVLTDDRWRVLAQGLLASNEFLFVD